MWTIVFALSCSGTDSPHESHAGGGDSDTAPTVPPKPTCVDIPQLLSTDPLATSAESSGFEYCYFEGSPGDGYVNRKAAVTCLADPKDLYTACNGSHTSACSNDSDCGEGGLCVVNYYKSLCGCVYPCTQDSDCGTGETCVCGGYVNVDGKGAGPEAFSRCEPSNCSSGADCASGECGLGTAPCYGATGTFCRLPTDECRTNSDCDGATVCGRGSETKSWICTENLACE